MSYTWIGVFCSFCRGSIVNGFRLQLQRCRRFILKGKWKEAKLKSSTSIKGSIEQDYSAYLVVKISVIYFFEILRTEVFVFFPQRMHAG